jgi:hypothetical protein
MVVVHTSPNQAKDNRLCAYADESSFNVGRYRGIGVVSLRENEVPERKSQIEQLLLESGVRELKWNRLHSAKKRFAAQKILDVIFEMATSSALRVDVLLWDTNDRRHIVRRRDDIENLQRMYYHLLRNVLQARWPDGSTWNLFPDENTSLNWNTVEDFLDKASLKTEFVRDFMSVGTFKFRLRKEFRIEEITPCKSHFEPLIQVADLFAGLGAYSHERYETFEGWRALTSAQHQLFQKHHRPVVKLSCADRERCQLLAYFDSGCKLKRLGVGLSSTRGLRTFNPRNPVNFWLYVPQREEDKAPVRRSVVPASDQ